LSQRRRGNQVLTPRLLAKQSDIGFKLLECFT